MTARSMVGLLVLLTLSSCAAEEAELQGIRTRVSVDRTETRVGDPIGVTVEIETPTDFKIEAPVAPGSDIYFTESIRLVDPIRIHGGVRHHLLWTLRAREVGDAPLPQLLIGVVRPAGEIQRMAVGGVPLAVLSVRDTLPERDAYFDIRPAPPPEPLPGWIWAAAAGAGVFLCMIAAALWVRSSRRENDEVVSTAELARVASASIEDALAEPDPRRLASSVQETALGFVGAVWPLPGENLTPAELPDAVDAELTGLIQELECVRFERQPTRGPLLETSRRLRERVLYVANA